jgi:hypothetical protein
MFSVGIRLLMKDQVFASHAGNVTHVCYKSLASNVPLRFGDSYSGESPVGLAS